MADGGPHCECIAGFHAVGLTCVRNAALCGDGSVDPGEECDDGNVVGRDGCESDCRFSCHADEECDDRDPCTADSCRATAAGRRCDNTPTAGLPCSDGNPCTEPDTCMLDPGGSARCAGGPNHCACVTTVDCAALEDGDLCNGTLVCIDGVCAVDPATVVMCDPTADTLCARNLCEPTTGRCRMQAGADGRPCDDGDWCTLTDRCEGGECVGSGARCTLACQVCNRASFTCDVAPGYCIVDDACVPEFDAARPDPRARNPENPCQGCRPAVDPVGWSDLPPGVDCNDGVWCNGNETCDGSGTCAAGAPPCPVGGCVGGCDEALDRCVPASSATECRASSGPCNLAERCDGANLTCPPDALRPATYECRPAAGPCDVAETCTGRSADCPSDGFRPATYECRPAAGPCDVAESCTGSSPACPANVSMPDGTPCAFCQTCDAGSCTAFAPLGTDPGSDCPWIDCDAYIYGWMGDTCFRYAAASTANNGMCDGAGGCTGLAQSCVGPGAPIGNGTCESFECRDTSGSSPCRPGALAPSSFAARCYPEGPCFCDSARHACPEGNVCNPPDGRCGLSPP